ncbi:hypothetical protein Tsp_03208 [Trichinella spiralis]|uniref:hypothetical protein n=1 Tax=Trichinella spiralis TaxID=6334 RepID=UPI0001EFC1A2|nr:hypothetical protein Tsp_03208 [Trichinella spiralis]
MCLPVSMIRSCTSPKSKFTTLLKRKARPVAPVNRVDTSSLRFVKNTSQFVQENSRVPPKCSKKRRPIQTILKNKKNNEKIRGASFSLFRQLPHRHGGGQSRISVNTTAKLNKRKCNLSWHHDADRLNRLIGIAFMNYKHVQTENAFDRSAEHDIQAKSWTKSNHLSGKIHRLMDSSFSPSSSYKFRRFLAEVPINHVGNVRVLLYNVHFLDLFVQ